MDAKARRTRRVDSCRIIEVIEVEVLEGKGTVDSLMRQVRYLYEKDGTLIARMDPCEGEEV